MRLETKILANLLCSDKFARQVGLFILPEYFEVKAERCIVEEFHKFFVKFSNIPDKDILKIELGNRPDLRDRELAEACACVDALDLTEVVEYDWLFQRAEQFCKDRAVYNAIMDSIKILDNEDKTRTISALPSLMQNALAVSFDKNIGHDYLEDWEYQYEVYHTLETKVPFRIYDLNRITDGGMSTKTLNVILAGTGVGKSLFMCDFAAGALMDGFNVLYITLEMSQAKIAERIDANLMNVPIKEVKRLHHDSYSTRMRAIAEKARGRLIIKEYPTASANVEHFKALIEELKQKKGFKPDVIIVDYINICASSRIKLGNTVGSYALVKAISEELRGMAQQYDVPVLSATQATRDGHKSSDLELTDTSESWGLPQTVDLMFALIATEELAEQNQVLVKQLKNRYDDINIYRKFVIGIDKSKMQLYQLEDCAQDGLVGAGIPDDRDVNLQDENTYAGFNYE